MKKLAFAAALLIGGAAFAQSADVASDAYHGDGAASAAFETEGPASADMAAFADPAPAAQPLETAAAPGAIVQPGNVAPERDARGIAVLSDAAYVPAGWNGSAAAGAMGGPLVDTATGEAAGAEASYPACTATVTDNCLQTYERQGR